MYNSVTVKLADVFTGDPTIIKAESPLLVEFLRSTFAFPMDYSDADATVTIPADQYHGFMYWATHFNPNEAYGWWMSPTP